MALTPRRVQSDSDFLRHACRGQGGQVTAETTTGAWAPGHKPLSAVLLNELGHLEAKKPPQKILLQAEAGLPGPLEEGVLEARRLVERALRGDSATEKLAKSVHPVVTSKQGDQSRRSLHKHRKSDPPRASMKPQLRSASRTSRRTHLRALFKSFPPQRGHGRAPDNPMPSQLKQQGRETVHKAREPLEH